MILRTFFLALTAATLLLVPAPGASAGAPYAICIDPFGTFYPLVIGGGCYFGVEPESDAMIIYGRAILNGDYAAPGTAVEAFVDAVACGTAEVPSGGVFRLFDLRVRGASERAGCGAAGSGISFTVGGVPASETRSWDDVGLGPWFQSLTATPNHAWYWFERRGDHLPVAGTVVDALVVSHVCGSASLEREIEGPFLGVPGDAAGFSQLVVSSAEIEDGCGELGATVSFRVGAVAAVEELSWEPGVQRLDLQLYGDVSCNLVVDAIDAALMLQADAQLLDQLDCPASADANDDGASDALDATLVLQFGAGLLASFPPAAG